jgi:hypothetical protein
MVSSKLTPNEKAREEVHKILDTFDGYGSSYKRLSEAQRAVYNIFWFDALVVNGGYEHYFRNESGDHYLDTIEDLGKIGAYAAQQDLENACKLFPAQRPDPKWERRAKQLDALYAHMGVRYDHKKDPFKNTVYGWDGTELPNGKMENVFGLLLTFWKSKEKRAK